MTTPSRPPRAIGGKGCTIRELIAGRKYSIGYRQREYKCPHTKYAQRGRKGYEIEQFWVDNSQRHVERFAHLREFAKHRNDIRGFLLLPKNFLITTQAKRNLSSRSGIGGVLSAT